MSCLKSQEMRKIAPELDPLRIGTGWKPEDLSKPQVIIESTYGDSHPGSGHLNILVEEVKKGIEEAGGFGARYYCTDMCDNLSFDDDLDSYGVLNVYPYSILFYLDFSVSDSEDITFTLRTMNHLLKRTLKSELKNIIMFGLIG